MTLDQLTAILAKHDPIGLIKMGAPPDEYKYEARLILPLLAIDNVNIAQEARRVFSSQFDTAVSRTGPRETYEAIAQDIRAALSSSP